MSITQENIPQSLAVSPDGSKILVGCYNGAISLIDYKNYNQPKLILRGFGASVGGTAFSPDGTRIAVGLYNTVAYICDTETLQDVGLLYGGHQDRLANIRFSQDGEFIITCSFNGEVRLWKATGDEQGTLLAAYNGSYPIGDIFWHENDYVLLIDRGYYKSHPYIHRLKIEGVER